VKICIKQMHRKEIYNHSRFLQPKVSILHPKVSILHPMISILQPRIDLVLVVRIIKMNRKDESKMKRPTTNSRGDVGVR
jgi:hypothetical protein